MILDSVAWKLSSLSLFPFTARWKKRERHIAFSLMLSPEQIRLAFFSLWFGEGEAYWRH